MKDLQSEIAKTSSGEGSAAVWWLAQAGFVFKSTGGTVIYLDPYLSDAVEREFGFKRLSLAPIEAEKVRADWVISSHEHLDHLDTDALSVIKTNNPDCMFAGPESCREGWSVCGISYEKQFVLKPGRDYRLGDVALFTARADHGELSPDALAMLFDFGRIGIMFTGDTALNTSYLQSLIDLRPDVLIPCINGRFGNMDAEEAARLTAIIRPKTVIPCHFWMFKEHNGDPQSFVDACNRLCPEVKVKVMKPGESIYFGLDT